MKHINLLKWIVTGLVIVITTTSEVSYAQTRSRKLPNGTIIYSDGTIKRADGTIKYPDGRIGRADGSVKYPDGTVRYPSNRNGNKQWLPPGQAKKRYGTKSAKPFAPGQQKKRFDFDRDIDNGKGKNK